jgi:putative SOS response-associated peptidase YedK
MCGRFALSANSGNLEKLVPELKINTEIIGRYNIAPSQNIYALIKTGQTELTELRWGLIPSWAKDESIGNRIINARSETLSEKPAFRQLIKRKRCLIPATGYYEWRKIPGEKGKQPYFIKIKNKELITIAGLWDEWRSPDGKIIKSTTLITRPAAKDIEFIHDRMPAIIPENLRTKWLDADSSYEEISNMLKNKENNIFEYYPVSKAVNNPAYDDENLILKLSNEFFN